MHSNYEHTYSKEKIQNSFKITFDEIKKSYLMEIFMSLVEKRTIQEELNKIEYNICNSKYNSFKEFNNDLLNSLSIYENTEVKYELKEVTKIIYNVFKNMIKDKKINSSPTSELEKLEFREKMLIVFISSCEEIYNCFNKNKSIKPEQKTYLNTLLSETNDELVEIQKNIIMTNNLEYHKIYDLKFRNCELDKECGKLCIQSAAEKKIINSENLLENGVTLSESGETIIPREPEKPSTEPLPICWPLAEEELTKLSRKSLQAPSML